MLRSFPATSAASPQQTTSSGQVVRTIHHQRGGSIGKTKSVCIMIRQPPITPLSGSSSVPSLSPMGQTRHQISSSIPNTSLSTVNPSQAKRVTFDVSTNSKIIDNHDGSSIHNGTLPKGTQPRSPSQKWSPGLLSTIVEVSRESLSSEVTPAKLFEDYDVAQKSFKGEYPGRDRMGCDTGNSPCGPLAPSLEPNSSSVYTRSVLDCVNRGKKEDEESSVEKGLLFREIERLANHDFDATCRQAPYPEVLQRLFQRLRSDHVVSKRRKMWIESKDQTIKDFQTQLVESQQKHRRLLNDIFNLPGSVIAASNSPIVSIPSERLHPEDESSAPTEQAASIAPTATTSSWSGCSISAEDASRIKSILNEVKSNGESASERTPIGTLLQTLSSVPLPPPQQSLFLALQNAASKITSSSGDHGKLQQDGCTSLDTSKIMSEATTRLLQAETVLGLLKLVMAQNQADIQGLEEEVSRKQSELAHHHLLFDCAVKLDRSGYEAQIEQGQIQVRTLTESLQASREETDRHADRIADLTKDIQDLNEAKQRQISKEQALLGQIQSLENEVQELHGQQSEMERELASGRAELEGREATILDQERQLAELKAVSEKWVVSEEQQQEILDHLERKQQKETSDLKARLNRVQKEKKRLEKEVSTLSVKIVRVQSQNEELEEQLKQDQVETESLKVSLLNKTNNSDSRAPSEEELQEILELKAQVTSLEIQIEDLTTTLRLKENELDRAQGEIEAASLLLEQQLAAQKTIHEADMKTLAETKRTQAERERACQSKNVAHFQNMVSKLRTELDEKDEKLRDIMTSWNQTKDQVQRHEASLRRRRRELEAVQMERDEVQRALTEVNDRLQNVSVAIELLEQAEAKNVTLVQTIKTKDQALSEMEYRLRQLEDDGEELYDVDDDEQGEERD